VTVANIAPSSISSWRPLSNNQTEPAIVPRILVYHTMVGYLRSTENMFKQNGFWGTESTWGVGGPWDGDSLDGVAWQWQGVKWQADAQFEANAWCDSIETSDGGIWKPATPAWSDKQVKKLIQIGAWWCTNTGNDPVIAKSYDGRGLGYHQLFKPWNQESHNCPGPKRVEQFRDLIVPAIQKAVNGGHVDPPEPPITGVYPPFPLSADGFFGKGGTLHQHGLDKWQRQMHARGWTIGVDGEYGPETESVAKQFQREKSLRVDGFIGPNTWKTAWTAKVT
jgi:peptidoglycan hydrolase-like protein with peptidoglycan-binding domain